MPSELRAARTTGEHAQERSVRRSVLRSGRAACALFFKQEAEEVHKTERASCVCTCESICMVCEDACMRV